MAIFQFRTGHNVSRIKGVRVIDFIKSMTLTPLIDTSYFRRETCTDLPVASRVIL